MGNLHRRPPLPTSLEFRLDRLKQTSDLRTEAMRRYFDGIPHLAEVGWIDTWHNSASMAPTSSICTSM